MNHHRIFLFYFLLIFNFIFINNIYCFSIDIDTVDTDSIKKDTIKAKFQIISIEKIEGNSFYYCPKCKLGIVKFQDYYYKNNKAIAYQIKQKRFIRKAYLIEVINLVDKKPYVILSLKEPRDGKKKGEKIKIDEIYELQAIKYYDKDKKPSHFIYNISIDKILFKLNYVGCNLLLPLNLKGLYYYE